RACARGWPSCCATPAFRWSSASSAPCSCGVVPSTEEMELQRPRRRGDQLGHEPLCDVRARRVRREAHARPRVLESLSRRAGIEADRACCIGERALENVATHEHAEVGAAVRVTAVLVEQYSAVTDAMRSR